MVSLAKRMVKLGRREGNSLAPSHVVFQVDVCVAALDREQVCELRGCWGGDVGEGGDETLSDVGVYAGALRLAYAHARVSSPSRRQGEVAVAPPPQFRQERARSWRLTTRHHAGSMKSWRPGWSGKQSARRVY